MGKEMRGSVSEPLNIAERTRIGSAIEEAAELLPAEWCIRIHIEHHGGDVQLFDPEFEKRDYPTNHEFLSDEIRDATEYAIEQAAASGKEGETK